MYLMLNTSYSRVPLERGPTYHDFVYGMTMTEANYEYASEVIFKKTPHTLP